MVCSLDSVPPPSQALTKYRCSTATRGQAQQSSLQICSAPRGIAQWLQRPMRTCDFPARRRCLACEPSQWLEIRARNGVGAVVVRRLHRSPSVSPSRAPSSSFVWCCCRHEPRATAVGVASTVVRCLQSPDVESVNQAPLRSQNVPLYHQATTNQPQAPLLGVRRGLLY